MSPLDLGPVPRQAVSDTIHARLRGEILSGRLEPGEALPSERALSEAYGVNRHAIREALKRLQQAGLVQISQGGATRVLDWRAHGGLDLLFDLAPGGELPSAEILRSVLEMRATIGVDAARRCAERAPKRVRGDIERLANATAEATRAADAAAFGLYERLWRRIVDGSANLAYRLALNSLLAGAGSVPAAAEHLGPGPPDQVEALGRAVAQGEGGKAAEVASRLLEPPA
jgi:GntR family transcriptional regulator, transcriptional repressor for pyruvate dehydrogenase complex